MGACSSPWPGPATSRRQLARAGQVSPFGAFLDSVLDRYSDLLVLAGLLFLFVRLGRAVDVVATLAALVGTVMVSYTRARAESIGVECKVGLMERGERLLILIAGALADLLIPAVWVVAAGANATALHRSSTRGGRPGASTARPSPPASIQIVGGSPASC
jgi:CDP-diacylglycerol--glycerol-3-phosphate 3-phosphatidyltransferase